jgi:hypothetical protein
MEFHGEKKKKKFHGFPWTSMDFRGTPWTIHGLPWTSVDFHGIPWSL